MGGEQGWLIFGVQSKRKVEEAAAEVWRGEGGGEVGFSLTEQWSEAKEEHTCLCVCVGEGDVRR